MFHHREKVFHFCLFDKKTHFQFELNPQPSFGLFFLFPTWREEERKRRPPAFTSDLHHNQKIWLQLDWRLIAAMSCPAAVGRPRRRFHEENQTFGWNKESCCSSVYVSVCRLWFWEDTDTWTQNHFSTQTSDHVHPTPDWISGWKAATGTAGPGSRV